MARKAEKPKPRPLSRKVAIRQPRKTLVILCEGQRTEPVYLGALKLQPEVKDVAAVDLRIEAQHGEPAYLVESAIEARVKSADEEGEVDEFWCVFDVEWPQNHPRLLDAVKEATENGIRLAISNPCFELWLILHFRDHHSWLDNADARRLRRHLDGATGKDLEPAKYMRNIHQAVARAASLHKRHLRDG